MSMDPIAQVLPAALASIVRRAPLSAGKVDFVWRTSVGPALARVTAVRLEDGVLLVEAQSPSWSLAIKRSSRIILSRLQDLLGAEAVRDIHLRA
ncbi:MAG: DUF721 domain-containing protein [Acidobacteria bacterium]|nr:DUF721 domain-containing protein [Acidobacteriota bacterium]